MSQSSTFERELIFRTPDFPLDVSIWENHPDYPLLTNDFCEISIVLGGTAFKLVGDEEFPLQTGDIFAFSGDTAHGYRSTRNLKVINVIYDAGLLEQVKFDADQLPGYRNLFYDAPGGGSYRIMNSTSSSSRRLPPCAASLKRSFTREARVAGQFGIRTGKRPPLPISMLRHGTVAAILLPSPTS